MIVPLEVSRFTGPFWSVVTLLPNVLPLTLGAAVPGAG